MRVLVEADAALQGGLTDRRRRAGGWLEGLSFARGSVGQVASQRLAREYGVDGPQMRADAKLAEAVEVISRNCGVGTLRLLLLPGGLKWDVILSIARKGPERQRSRDGALRRGPGAVGRPEAGTWPMDTRDFAKVASRLGRALGHVDACAAAAPAILKALRPTREEGVAIRGHLEGIVAGSRRLLRLVRGAGRRRRRGARKARGPPAVPRGGRE